MRVELSVNLVKTSERCYVFLAVIAYGINVFIFAKKESHSADVNRFKAVVNGYEQTVDIVFVQKRRFQSCQCFGCEQLYSPFYLFKLYECLFERARLKRFQQIVDAVELEGVERVFVECRDEYTGNSAGIFLNMLSDRPSSSSMSHRASPMSGLSSNSLHASSTVDAVNTRCHSGRNFSHMAFMRRRLRESFSIMT